MSHDPLVFALFVPAVIPRQNLDVSGREQFHLPDRGQQITKNIFSFKSRHCISMQSPSLSFFSRSIGLNRVSNVAHLLLDIEEGILDEEPPTRSRTVFQK